MCYRPPLLGMSSPSFFCCITNILVVAICRCHVLSYFLGCPQVCSWLPPFNHRCGCGHLLVFLVVLLMAIVGAMVVLFLFLVASSYPLLWLWSYSCVLSCLLLAMVMVIFLFSIAFSYPWSWSSSSVLSCALPTHRCVFLCS